MSEAKIRLKKDGEEVEIEGSETFINQKITEISQWFPSLMKGNTIQRKEGKEEHFTESSLEDEPRYETTHSIPEQNFRSLWKRIKENTETPLKKMDIALVAGYFWQKQTKETYFLVRDINELLRENGIKLSSLSSFLNVLMEKGYVHQGNKLEGQQTYFVSLEGEDYIEELLGDK